MNAGISEGHAVFALLVAFFVLLTASNIRYVVELGDATNEGKGPSSTC